MIFLQQLECGYRFPALVHAWIASAVVLEWFTSTPGNPDMNECRKSIPTLELLQESPIPERFHPWNVFIFKTFSPPDILFDPQDVSSLRGFLLWDAFIYILPYFLTFSSSLMSKNIRRSSVINLPSLPIWPNVWLHSLLWMLSTIPLISKFLRRELLTDFELKLGKTDMLWLLLYILLYVVRRYIYLSLSWAAKPSGHWFKGAIAISRVFCPSKMIFQMLPPLSSWQEIPIRFSSRRESAPCDARISRHPTMD